MPAPADPESPKGLGFGLGGGLGIGPGSGCSGPTCKVKIDDTLPAQSYAPSSPAPRGVTDTPGLHSSEGAALPIAGQSSEVGWSKLTNPKYACCSLPGTLVPAGVKQYPKYTR